MDKNVKLKDVIIDKSIEASVKTKEVMYDGLIIATKSTKKTVKAGAYGAKDGIKQGINIITNSSDDIYEEVEDISEDVTKEIVADSGYVVRNTFRVGYSVYNLNKKHRLRNNYIRTFVQNRELDEALLDGEIKSTKETNNTTLQEEMPGNFCEDSNRNHLDGKKRKNQKRSYKDRHFYTEGRNEWRQKSRKEKKQFYRENGWKPGIKPRKSLQHTFINQNRKLLESVSHKEDISAKTIGLSAKQALTVIRYKKTVTTITKKVVLLFKHALSSAIHLICSLPAIIIAICSSLPVILTLLIFTIVMSVIAGSSYSGHITEFVDNEVYLEYRYDANVAPDEILSITTALNWTSQEKSNYEALFALLLDGKDENWNITYEHMLDNIFIKYNPATFTWRNDIRVKRQTWYGAFTTEILTYEDYLNLYPEYKNLPINKKAIYGSEQKTSELKSVAYEALDQAGINYTKRYIDTETSLFSTDPLDLNSIRIGAATYKVGYRSFMDGAFHGGTDIAAPVGTDVFAVSDAKVIAIFNNATASGDVCTDSSRRTISQCGLNYAGNQVILEKEITDKRTDTKAYLYIAYFHLQKDSVTVHPGDYVSAGQLIGKVGNTGMSFGGHLHFQGWIDTISRYQLPYSVNNDAITVWQRTVDLSMLCNINFRNHIYGR